MQIFFLFKNLLFFAVLSLNATLVPAQDSSPAIATILQIEGSVEVLTNVSPKGLRGRDGMLLFAGNKIRTAGKSKATVEYRDGSRIRLFQNSELLLDLSEEQNTSKRTFKYLLSLNNGSLRGRFKKGLQRTKIRTPNALVRVKGTSVRITENKNKATVSLTEGQVEVSNLSSRAIIYTGQWLPEFGRTDDLSIKVVPIPNLLNLITDEYELDFSDGKSKQFPISVQLQNSISSNIIKRKGLVIIESDYDRIRLPKRFLLDNNGYARVQIGIDPPRIDDSKFRGLITIRAIMDEDGFDDVAEGNLVLKIRNSGKSRTIILDPDKGITENND